jgi:ABC-type Fe3+-siderophore transport system permease subunit
VIWDFRLSRALVAACCGAGLAICGAVLQSLLKNALAEPYVLGVSAGASTGAVSSSYWGSAPVRCRSLPGPLPGRSPPLRLSRF